MTRHEPRRRRELALEDYVAGIEAGDRAILARAITLVESRHARHQALAAALLDAVMPATGGAHRVGVTGVPGVGKSTFIDRLGRDLVAAGRRVAVLAVDPTSRRTGGSILGDKTRMAGLAACADAYIRPSPAAGTLGGVARMTRETILLCEAAGFDVILVETVGVGQSETAVADMVDAFLVLLLAGAGDELQGIKKGLLEIADVIAVTKADGDNRDRARRAAREAKGALHITIPTDAAWTPPVLTVSALGGDGMDALWAEIERHRDAMRESGAWEARRRDQRRSWLWSTIEDRLIAAFRADPRVAARLAEAEAAVLDGTAPPTRVADALLAAFQGDGAQPLATRR